jgi:NADPH2:quinone reductase
MDRAAEVFSLIYEGTLRTNTGAAYALPDAARAHRDPESRSSTDKLLLRA